MGFRSDYLCILNVMPFVGMRIFMPGLESQAGTSVIMQFVHQGVSYMGQGKSFTPTCKRSGRMFSFAQRHTEMPPSIGPFTIMLVTTFMAITITFEFVATPPGFVIIILEFTVQVFKGL